MRVVHVYCCSGKHSCQIRSCIKLCYWIHVVSNTPTAMPVALLYSPMGNLFQNSVPWLNSVNFNRPAMAALLVFRWEEYWPTCRPTGSSLCRLFGWLVGVLPTANMVVVYWYASSLKTCQTWIHALDKERACQTWAKIFFKNLGEDD